MGYVLGIGVGFALALVVLLAREFLQERRPRPRRICGEILSANGFTISRSVVNMGTDGIGDPIRCTRECRHEPPCCAVIGGKEIWWRSERKA